MELIAKQNTGNIVTVDMFGANSMYDLNTLPDGTMRAGFEGAVSLAGVTNLRFPGGMVEHVFNVTRLVNGDIRSEVKTFLDGIRALNTNGNDLGATIVLPTKTDIPFLAISEFVRLIVRDYSDVVTGFEVGNEYSVGAPNPSGIFQLHPEDHLTPPPTYATDEYVYGQQANKTILAIHEGVQNSGMNYDPVVLLQMADISGGASAFKGTGDYASADQAILSGLSNLSMALVDGVVGHYYYNKNHDGSDSESFAEDWREVRDFPKRIELWQQEVTERFGPAYAVKDIYMTEWNTNIRTLDQLGLKGASVLAEQFEQMIRMGVDGAHAWPLQHNTANTLAGHYRDGMTDLALSPAGAVFSILADVLTETESSGSQFSYSETAFFDLNSSVEVNSFSSNYQTVFTVSNRSHGVRLENMSFGTALGNVTGYEMYQIGIDPNSSDGLAMGGNPSGGERLGRRTLDSEDRGALYQLPFFDPANSNHTKTVNGVEKTYLISPEDIVAKTSNPTSVSDYWFLSEPDVHAQVTYTEGTFSSATQGVQMLLNPFEVAVVVVEHSHQSEGTGASEFLNGGVGQDNILGREGSDTILGHEGNDTLKGGWGNDLLIGGEGHDHLVGGQGNDVMVISTGSANVDGGEGIDTIRFDDAIPHMRLDLMYSHINTRAAQGSTFTNVENVFGTAGSDNIRGTLADNLLIGGSNVDYLFGRRGNDTLEGGIGDDVLFGGVGADVLNGGAHRDRAQYSESLSGLTIDLLDPSSNTGEAAGDVFILIEDIAGSRFEDTIFGDNADNRLFGREGNDALLGRHGDDYLNGGAGSDTLVGGEGDDVLRGGANADVFIFTNGHDIVEDFNPAMDTLSVQGTNVSELSSDIATQQGNHLLLEIDPQNSILLWNVDADEIFNL